MEFIHVTLEQKEKPEVYWDVSVSTKKKSTKSNRVDRSWFTCKSKLNFTKGFHLIFPHVPLGSYLHLKIV